MYWLGLDWAEIFFTGYGMAVVGFWGLFFYAIYKMSRRRRSEMNDEQINDPIDDNDGNNIDWVFDDFLGDNVILK